jgi:hypothetical protein
MVDRFPEHSAAVDVWFRQHGWPVTSTHHDFDRDIYGWRSESAAPQQTLRITQRVLEDTPAAQLGAVLDSLKVADAMTAKPKAYTIVKQEQGHPVLAQLDKPPRAD